MPDHRHKPFALYHLGTVEKKCHLGIDYLEHLFDTNLGSARRRHKRTEERTSKPRMKTSPRFLRKVSVHGISTVPLDLPALLKPAPAILQRAYRHVPAPARLCPAVTQLPSPVPGLHHRQSQKPDLRCPKTQNNSIRTCSSISPSGTVSGTRNPSATAKRSATSRSSMDSGTPSAPQMAPSSSEEASF